jgi:hypothetical protein
MAQKRVNTLANLLAAGRIHRGQVIDDEIQDLAGTVRAGHLGRAVKAVELEWDATGRIGVVLPHPVHQLSIRVQPAKAVAEPGVLYSLVRCGAAAGHVLAHHVRPGETALDGNGAEAMRLHQVPEEPVAEEENVLAAVERFSKAEQFHRVAECGHHLVHGDVKGAGRIDRKGNRLACNPIVESCVQEISFPGY